jgi:serine protease AprX
MSGTSMATPVVAATAALMIQNDISITPDTIKARMMKTAWKGFPTTSVTVVNGIIYTLQDDVFTVGAGYLDIDAAMRSLDVTTGSAVSPMAVFNPTTGAATLVDSPPLIAGSSVVWDQTSIWGSSTVWGGNAVLANSIIWEFNGSVLDDPTLAGNSLIWADSITWEATDVTSESITWDE